MPLAEREGATLVIYRLITGQRVSQRCLLALGPEQPAGVFGGVFARSPLVSQLMARLPLALIVRKDHPLAVSEHLRGEDIERYPVIRSTPYSTRDMLPVVVSPLPDKLPAVTIEDFDALSHIASVSDAIWLTSPQAVGRALTVGDLVEVPITWLHEAPYVEVTAYYLRKATLSPIVESMLKSMAAMGAHISSNPET